VDKDAAYDLVIDDGSHIAEDVLGVLAHCWKWVKPGGYYVIEDMGCTYNDGYRDKFNKHFGKDLKNVAKLTLPVGLAVARSASSIFSCSTHGAFGWLTTFSSSVSQIIRLVRFLFKLTMLDFSYVNLCVFPCRRRHLPADCNGGVPS